MLTASNAAHAARDRAAAGDRDAGPREVAVAGARDRGHRDRARDRLRGADRAPDPPARPGDPADGHRGLLAGRRTSTARRTCATSGSGSNGCARGSRELEQQQNRFLRHVSHELKTPLTAVREGAELLRDEVGGKLSPRAARHRAHRSREHAVAAEADRGPARNTTRRARSSRRRSGRSSLAGRRAARAAREQARRARARHHVRDATSTAPVVVGDADRLRTIVDNLVSQRDQVLVARRRDRGARLAGGRRGACSTSPTTGPASRPTSASAIFDSFYQGKAPPGGRVKGSGLGLAIAREYALAHGGRIEIRDRADGARGALLSTLRCRSRRRRARDRGGAARDVAAGRRRRSDGARAASRPFSLLMLARLRGCAAGAGRRRRRSQRRSSRAPRSRRRRSRSPRDRVAADRAGRAAAPRAPVPRPEPAPSPPTRSAQVAVIAAGAVRRRRRRPRRQ